MFLLTEGPHLYYVDAGAGVRKGEVPWSKTLWPECKNFKIFFVHTVRFLFICSFDTCTRGVPELLTTIANYESLYMEITRITS